MSNRPSSLAAAVTLVPADAPAELWRAAAEASEDAVFGFDAEGTVLGWTRGAARVFGYAADRIVGRAVANLLPQAQVERVLAGERIDRLHIDVRRSDGMVVPVALTLIPFLGRGGGALVRDLTEQRVAQSTLAESEERLREAQELSHVGLWLWNFSSDDLQWSDELYSIHALDPRDFGSTMRAYGALVHPDDRPGLDRALALALGGVAPLEREFRIVRPNGEVRWLYARSTFEWDEAGRAVGLRGIGHDVTERKRAAEALRAQASLLELLRRMAVAANEASDLDEALRACLRDVCAHTGWQVAHVRYLHAGRLVPSGIWTSDDPARFAGLREIIEGPASVDDDSLREAVDTAKPVWRTDLAAGTVVARAASRHGLESFVALPLMVGTEVVAVLGFFSAERDEPDPQLLATIWDGANQASRVVERRRAQDELAHRALHDPLTGLPNRTLLFDRLAQALEQRRQAPTTVALVMVDIDEFKAVNDSLGHDVGDRLLLAVACRIRSVIRPGDTAARFGGDEFIILCAQQADEDVAVAMAERVLSALAEPIVLQGTQETVVSASVGIAIAGPAARPQDLLRDADSAMHQAKEAGRGGYQIFNAAMHRRAMKRLEVAEELRLAIDRDELRVLYQPQVDVGSGRLVGVEALVRWQHPKRGFLAPSEFIAVAEETQLIVPLGRWVLREACRQAAAWSPLDLAGEALKLCVNVSARQLARPELVSEIVEILAETGLEPTRLCVEITESLLMNDAAHFMDSLIGLRLAGVQIAIDDFGTGYSSLAYLRRFPIDVIKVDKGFIDGLAHDDQRGRAVVAAVVDLAHALDLAAVAEGVETPEQLQVLHELGCDTAQGYWFARPMPPECITALLDHPSEPVRSLASP